MSEFPQLLQQGPWLDYLALLLIPLTSALIGWGTNKLAVKMMFYPLEFQGKRPFLGWQGVVPANGSRMASFAIELMLGKLIKVEEIFDRIDPKTLTALMARRFDQMLERIIIEAMRERSPMLWEMLPQMVKNQIYRRVRKDADNIMTEIHRDLRDNLPEVIDVEKMMKELLIQDKELLNEFFLKVGRKEYVFVERSGLYFGFLFGLPSMIIWETWGLWWTLLLGGLIVGYLTNWLAIKMLFEPVNPTKVGPFTFHGLFLRRQAEVSRDYAELVATRLLTPENLLDTLLNGPHANNLLRIVETHVNHAIDKHASLAKPYVLITMGSSGYLELKQSLSEKLMEGAREPLRYTHAYTAQAMDIQGIMSSNMRDLSSKEFEGVLRPVFQQDEWKLIAVGGVLGMLAGYLQYLILI